MNHICPNHVNCGNEVAENRGEKKKEKEFWQWSCQNWKKEEREKIDLWQ